MRFRRVLVDDRLEMQVLDQGRWLPAPNPGPIGESAFGEHWQLAIATR